MSYSTGI